MKRMICFSMLMAVIIFMAGCAAFNQPPVITIISQDGNRRQVASIPTSVSEGEVVHIRSGSAEYFISPDVPTLFVGDKVAFQVVPLPTPGSLYPSYKVTIENMNTTSAGVIMWEDRLGWLSIYSGAHTSFLVGYIDKNGDDHPLRIGPGGSKEVKIFLDPEYECKVKITLDCRTYPYYLTFRVAPPAQPAPQPQDTSQAATSTTSAAGSGAADANMFPFQNAGTPTSTVAADTSSAAPGVAAGATSSPATRAGQGATVP